MGIQQLFEKLFAKKVLSYSEFTFLEKTLAAKLPAWTKNSYADAFQTTLLKFLHQPLFGKVRDPFAYFKRSVRNECFDQKHASDHFVGYPEWLSAGTDEASAESSQVMNRTVIKAMRQLNEKDLRILILLYWFDTPRETLSEQLNLSRNALRQKIHRLLIKVKNSVLVHTHDEWAAHASC